MTERTPKKFVGLHSHSCLSIGDAIGLPQDHIDFAIENGADALALTDHGNMNGFSHQYLHAKKLKEKGVNFKAIPGVEAYFIPSLVDWHKMYQERKIEKEEARKAAEEEQDDLETSEEKNEEEEGGTVVENEEETKERKVKDPLKKRSHLVLLAKNQAGLKSLFRLVSNSYIDGFYLYPRMDFDGLKEHAKGNIIASSACVSGNAILETNVGLLSLKEVVERVKNGEEILTLSYDEGKDKVVFAKVSWGDCTQKNAKLLQIKLEDGTSIKVTGDHKVFTNKGWLRADQLKENMPLRILTSNT